MWIVFDLDWTHRDGDMAKIITSPQKRHHLVVNPGVRKHWKSKQFQISWKTTSVQKNKDPPSDRFCTFSPTWRIWSVGDINSIISLNLNNYVTYKLALIGMLQGLLWVRRGTVCGNMKERPVCSFKESHVWSVNDETSLRTRQASTNTKVAVEKGETWLRRRAIPVSESSHPTQACV